MITHRQYGDEEDAVVRLCDLEAVQRQLRRPVYPVAVKLGLLTLAARLTAHLGEGGRGAGGAWL